MEQDNKPKPYRPDLGSNTKELTLKLQTLLQQFGVDCNEGETVAEAVRFALILSSAIMVDNTVNAMSWEEFKAKILIKVLE